MKKRNRDTPLANWALQKLAEYIASKRDLDAASPREIEAALKKAGKLPIGDHFYTAFHAGLKAIGIRRGAQEKKAAGQESWMYLDTIGAGTDAVYGRYRHMPCGTELEILQGHMARTCPTCQPEEWEARLARE
jgi:hypothetical protein